MLKYFQAETADELWRRLAVEFSHGAGTLQDGRQSPTHELLHVGLELSQPRQRWVSRIPPINPAFALAEVIWILNGRDDAGFLNYWNRQLPRFAGASATYRGAYGYRLRHHFGVDQIVRAARALSRNPTSRQVVLQIWDASLDLPTDSGEPQDADIPCNVCSLLKVREGRLDWTQVVRSNDLLLGLPYNLVQFTTLQEVLAAWIGVEVGEFNQISDSLHVYVNDIATINGAVAVGPQPRAENTDQISTPLEESLLWLATLDNLARLLTSDPLGEAQLIGCLQSFDGPQPFRNWLTILAAESARRRNWPELAAEVHSQCTNPALASAWARWSAARSRPSQYVASGERGPVPA